MTRLKLSSGMDEIAIIILAAGKSSRMRGRDKLTQRINGVAQIRRIAKAACEICANVFVTVPDAAHPRASFLLGLNVQIISVPEAHQGMGRSIASGVGCLTHQNLSAAMIIPADMPELTQMDLETIATAYRSHPNNIIQATTPSGKRGHPVIFPYSTFDQLKMLSGDEGGRAVIEGNKHLHQLVPIPYSHARTDLDTPEEWQYWLANQN
ncbi:MAG: nucleotidyltransferase family protein [Paracoccaceae bacterium]|nr:nucleotidyltransferase family protein [Paracoccaceae bacterium]